MGWNGMGWDAGTGIHTIPFQLNASDDRGIDIVRGPILSFASTRTIFKYVVGLCFPKFPISLASSWPWHLDWEGDLGGPGVGGNVPSRQGG